MRFWRRVGTHAIFRPGPSWPSDLGRYQAPPRFSITFRSLSKSVVRHTETGYARLSIPMP
ncbi:hypothetical protein DEF23_16100 [Marinitenerispora sediminis]|uniref:Uncharacterized protein n=1 Tax=Marinitenerispora sediminis TaxID=1931232 RepID=A0A368SZV5_9ACTN|nr:hypothetical protein DEF24_22760 [Marinitenerispora sediminis]RCV54286.1 hypothetical protein DEF23_16100 [Marinitenerispora sediminis]RCV56426.1 hypothetical protein DEF28_03775 [Marinitenerispora sediminis]